MSGPISRRQTMALVPACLAWATCRQSWARPADDPDARRLRARLELWAHYARKTESLVAQIATTRKAALLHKTWASTGKLAYLRPDRIVLRDDTPGGSTTIWTGNSARIEVNREHGAALAHRWQPADAATRWLGDHLMALFGARDPAALALDARVIAPRGHYRLELHPERATGVRRTIRMLAADLDPTAGAIVRLSIAESAGDRLTVELTDHRQNVDDATVKAIFAA